MMTRLPGVAVELTLAFRELNGAYKALPPERRPPSIGEWGELEAEIDTASRAGDRDRTLAAIRAWRFDQLRRIEEAER